MSATTTTTAVFFAASPHTASGFVALKPDHPAHPSRFCLADHISSCNYQRELKSLPFPDGTTPITMVHGVNARSRTQVIRGLIEIRHGDKRPVMLVAHSEDSTRRYLKEALEKGAKYVWFYGEKHHSHALACFAAGNPKIRIYLMSPLPTRPSLSSSLARMCRVICLSA